METDKVTKESVIANKPILKEKLGGVGISVFKNERGLSYVVGKGYIKKGESEWTNVNVTFFPDEFDRLATLILEIKKQVKELNNKTE